MTVNTLSVLECVRIISPYEWKYALRFGVCKDNITLWLKIRSQVWSVSGKYHLMTANTLSGLGCVRIRSSHDWKYALGVGLWKANTTLWLKIRSQGLACVSTSTEGWRDGEPHLPPTSGTHGHVAQTGARTQPFPGRSWTRYTDRSTDSAFSR